MLQLLLVDDDPVITQGLHNIITSYLPGVFEEHFASDGLDAISLMQRIPMDLVITDIKMQNMSGLELLKLIKKNELPCEVIILSGFDDFKLVREALRVKAYDYLLKPINISNFISLLTTLLPVLNNKSKTLVPIDLHNAMKELEEEVKIFYDVENKNYKSYDELIQILDDAKNAISQLDIGLSKNLLNVFFNHCCEEIISEEKLRQILINLVYDLMKCNETFIKVVASEKLTKNDAVNAAKNLPTFSQLEKQYIDNIVFYINQITNDLSCSSKYDLSRAKRYLEDYYWENISLDDVAATVSLSPNYFSTLFKKETGLTFRKYLKKVRIENAKKMMRETHLSINNIAMEVGYMDVSHFNRAFKIETGMSPSKYKKLNKT